MMVLLLGTLLGSLAWGADPMTRAQQAELDRVRAEVAGQVHLAAYDLLDELVYSWIRQPIFDEPTPVVLASVTVPVGLGTGMQALLENHLANALLHNPTANLRLVHCPQCTAVVVQSGPEATVVTKGIDNPAVLADLGAQTGRHALFVDLEAEGASLVLRARLTQLTPDLPVVWSHTLASSGSAPALLRETTGLKSAEDARAEYLAALRSRGRVDIPLRLAIRTYAHPTVIHFDQPHSEGVTGTPPPPFLWLQTGIEMAPTDGRAWTSSVLVGYSFIPQAYQGLMGQARVHRLVTGRVRSVTRPDLYVFAGAAVINVWGQATASFRKQRLNADELLMKPEDGDVPRTAFGTLHVGLDLRVGNRMGMSAFLETIPDLANSPNLGTYTRVFGIGFQSLGTEVTFWF